jgi:hypothetical protein
VHGPLTRILVAAVVVGSEALAGNVAAQDFGVGGQREPTLTTSRLGIESSWATFDQLGAKGDFFGVTVRGDVKLAKTVGLRLLMPVYAIQLDGQPTNVGLGDSELRVRVLLYDGHPWRFYYGLADQLPTGNTGYGLGQGGTQLSPFITGGWRTGSFVAFFNVADCIGLHPDFNPKHDPAPNDYVDPSTDEEIRTTVGGVGSITESLYFNFAVTAITPLLAQDAGTPAFIGGAALGFQASDAFKLVVIEQLPIAGQHRFDEKLGLNAYVYF